MGEPNVRVGPALHYCMATRFLWCCDVNTGTVARNWYIPTKRFPPFATPPPGRFSIRKQMLVGFHKERFVVHHARVPTAEQRGSATHTKHLSLV